MLPPVDPAVLSANPRFNALYTDLCNNKLSPNGTSKYDAKAQKEHDEFSKELHKVRVEATKRELIKSGLKDLSYRPHGLPEELQQTVLVIAALLHGKIADTDRYLLEDDIASFERNAGIINTALSKSFEEDVAVLCTMFDSGYEVPITELQASITKLKSDVVTNQAQLNESRLLLAQEASKLHGLYRESIETSIRVLEQTIHGAVARGARAKAEHLAAVAEGMDKKVRVQHGQLVSQLFTSAFNDALEARSGQVRSEMHALKRKARLAEGKLEEYERASGMENLVKEYGDVLQEIEKTEADIARLERHNNMEGG